MYERMNYMENKSNDIKKLLQFLFTMYAGKIRSGSGTDLNDNYAWLLATLANQEKASKENLEENIHDVKIKDYDKIREIIGNFHQLVQWYNLFMNWSLSMQKTEQTVTAKTAMLLQF